MIIDEDWRVNWRRLTKIDVWIDEDWRMIWRMIWRVKWPIRPAFRYHKHMNEIISVMRCRISLNHLAWIQYSIWLDYNIRFGLITTFNLAWIQNSIWLEYKLVYSSQMKSTIQGKWLCVIRTNGFALYRKGLLRYARTVGCGDSTERVVEKSRRA